MITACICSNCFHKFQELTCYERIAYKAIVDVFMEIGEFPRVDPKSLDKQMRKNIKSLEIKGFLTTHEVSKNAFRIRPNGIKLYDETGNDKIVKLYGICLSDEHLKVYDLKSIVDD